MNLKLDELTKEELQKIIEKIAKRLSKEQYAINEQVRDFA